MMGLFDDEVRDFGHDDCPDDVVREHVDEVLAMCGDELRWLGWRRGTAKEFAAWMVTEGRCVPVPGNRHPAYSGHLLDALKDDAREFGKRLSSLVAAARRQLVAGYDPERHQHRVQAANCNLPPPDERPFLYLTWNVRTLDAERAGHWALRRTRLRDPPAGVSQPPGKTPALALVLDR